MAALVPLDNFSIRGPIGLYHSWVLLEVLAPHLYDRGPITTGSIGGAGEFFNPNMLLNQRLSVVCVTLGLPFIRNDDNFFQDIVRSTFVFNSCIFVTTPFKEFSQSIALYGVTRLVVRHLPQKSII